MQIPPTSTSTSTSTPLPRVAPVRVADDTFVIQATVGLGFMPVAIHVNSMLIRGREPIVVDTGAAQFRDRQLEDLWSLVDPDDVRWVFLSHDDIDHAGNLVAVMDACPNATLLTSWLQCQRMANLPEIPPTRWRWLGADEPFEANDRTYVTVRPPLYDAPASRGLLDTVTGVYWAGDCFAAPVPRATADVADLAVEQWVEGFLRYQQWLSPWVTSVDEVIYHRGIDRFASLGIRTIASGHGPTIFSSHLPQAMDLLHRVPTAEVAPQPGQPALDQLVAAALTASSPPFH